MSISIYADLPLINLISISDHSPSQEIKQVIQKVVLERLMQKQSIPNLLDIANNNSSREVKLRVQKIVFENFKAEKNKLLIIVNQMPFIEIKKSAQKIALESLKARGSDWQQKLARLDKNLETMASKEDLTPREIAILREFENVKLATLQAISNNNSTIQSLI